MPKQKQTVKLNQLNSGIITEVNPLTQPEGSSVDELNISIRNDGSRKRRFGMSQEGGGQLIPLGASVTGNSGFSTFKWDLGDFSEGIVLSVVQSGNILDFFLTEADNSISANKVYSLTLSTEMSEKVFSYAQVDKYLVIATGVSVIKIEATSLDPISLEWSDVVLEVRDQFGVTDSVNGVLIDRGNDINYRPTAEEYTDIHAYNLYNQGWPNEPVWCFLDDDGKPKMLELPVQFASYYFFTSSKDHDTGLYSGIHKYPSNGDNYNLFLATDPTEEPVSVDGFNPQTMDRGLSLNSEAAKGRFIIDVFSRGQSRMSSLDGALTLPQDLSPRQVKTVAEFAGRVFYGGFSSIVSEGDDRSPRLGNYVLYSQLINNGSQIGQCYQVASPTSKDDNELVATDGGIVKVSGANGINHLESIGSSILVFAENGLWQILGGADFGFSADNYQIVKVTERGCISPKSVVNLGSQVMYWSEDGIYITETTDQGISIAKDVTRESIKSLYDRIEDKMNVVGTYDKFERSVKWLYEGNKELIYRANTSSWTKYEVFGDNLLKGYVEVPSYNRPNISDKVVVDNVQVVVDVEEVNINAVKRISSTSGTKYLYVTDTDYSFSSFSSSDFKDWGEYDAYGYISGSNITLGSSSNNKQSPYVTFHFYKTETGFDEDFNPINPSSCMVQTRWDWSDNYTSGKFGREFQAYRFRRSYMPTDSGDTFDNGYETVVTKNKLRGRGKALNLNLRTEEGKDLHLIGYEQEITSEQL